MFGILASAQLLEAAMLICFGISWPIDIYKSLRVKRTEGKSLAFMVIVFVGYLCGVAGKLTRAWQEDGLEAVTCLYAINALLVFVDIMIYLHFRARGSGPGLAGT